MFKKIKQWILPKEINFFDSLAQQSLLTSEIIRELAHFYVDNSSEDPKPIFDLIDQAKQEYSANLMELNSVFITPVDKEAISRLYIQLHWVELSVKHLIIEINAYQIFSLNQYRKLFDLLNEAMKKLTAGIKLLGDKQNDLVRQNVNDVIHLDNQLIEEYATTMAHLFKNNEMLYIMQQKEILTQMKEISKRIHICGNYLEDIVFKMN
jgi:uncharacterized protein Yka (UPF0111/DUF47 family)